MKAKKLFFGALACLAFAACSNDDELKNPNAKAENSFVSVRLVMSGDGASTRAWNEDADTDPYYAEGETAEVAVSNATFYFFDDNGNQVQPAQTKQKGDLQWTAQGDNSNTIDQISNVLLLLKDQAMPTQIAAVLNLPEGHAALSATTLSNLQKQLGSLNGAAEGKFVMSSSVYVVDGKALQATPVKEANIGRDTDAAIAANKADANPVTIPVERVLARVSVNYALTSDSYSSNDITSIYNASTQTFSTDDVEIIPYITGWWLHHTNTDSYLIKSLDPSYTWTALPSETSTVVDATTGWWNDPTDFRSYWANAYNNAYNNYRYSTQSNKDKYCFENTNQDKATTLMVAAKLMREDGGSMKSVDLVQWLSYNFLSFEDFTAYIATFLNGKGYSKTVSGGKTALTGEDFVAYFNDDDKRDAQDKNWKATLAPAKDVVLNNGTADLSQEEAIAALKANSLVGVFKYYNGGQTYYFTKINHNTSYKETSYAIIRNHKYVLTINSIKGLGTPVPNPDDDNPTDPTNPTPTPDPVPEYPDPTDPTPNPDPSNPDPDQPLDPETPTDDHSAIAAKIQILKYRVVKQDVSLDNK